MRKVLVLLFVLLPLAAFGQSLSVWDGPGANLAADVDTQAGTASYTGSWTASADIWDGYPGYHKGYLYTLYEASETEQLFTSPYPLGGPSDAWPIDPPELPATVTITAAAIAAAGGGALEVGKTYYLEVRAVAYDPEPFPGYPPAFYEVAVDQSNGVLIGEGEAPAGGARLSLSATPSSLTFSAGEDVRNLQLRLSASGTGSIEVTSIREDRTYPLWGEERGLSESVALTVPGGFSETVSRPVTLDTLERAKALGAGTEGSFTLRYVASGRDTWGNPVSATVNVPVAVSGALASTLSVQGVSVHLPDSPYFRGETVRGATITVQATGSGTVVGQVYVDDSLSWSANPAFSISISGTTDFAVEAPLPTAQAGVHTVRVQLISPAGVCGQSSYEVSAEEPPFPPQSLTLIPEVAELTDLAGTALAENVAGGVQYTFTGSATLRVLSLENLELPAAAVNGLVVRYEAAAPGVPIIAGGSVDKEGAGAQLASFAEGYLRIGRIFYDQAADPNRLTARADLHIPRLDTDVLTLEELAISREGVELASYSWDKADPKSFSAFGVSFRLHDVGADKALTLAEDPSNHRYSFSMSGSIAWSEKEGVDVQEKELVSFSGLTFFSDGDFEGGITVSEDFDLIPQMLTVTQAGIELEDDVLAFKLHGELKNLPAPIDVLNSTFTLAFDTEGNVQGGVVPINELVGGRGLSDQDSTEWDFGFATLDVTYLGLDLVIQQGTLNRDHSRVLIGADIYLDLLNEDGSDPGAEGRRIGFGEIGGESGLTGGLEIAFDGDVHWPSLEGRIDLLSGKSLDLGAAKVFLDNLALECGSGSFAFLFSGSFRLQIEAIEGGIRFVNLRVSLDGDISGPEIQGTDLSIMDFVSVRVGSVAWGGGAISYTEDQTTGEGVNRQPAIGEEPATIQVDSYLEIRGAAINIGSEDSSVMSGSFEQLLYYSVAGEHSFVLRQARVEVSGCELFADIKYDRTYMRIAGGVKMQNIEAKAVGKIGIIPQTAADGTPEPRAGEPTFGLFVLVGGLGIPVAPSVFLDRIGGGVFINPTNEDITTVLLLAGFKRPELDDEIASMRPGGGGDPGGFAVMLLGGVYVAERTLVEGEALITLTANYFSLDAKVNALEGMLRGRSYFLISWDPLYAEGNNVLEADLFDIFKVDGELAFYAYAQDAWGIMGGVRVALLGSDLASGSFFIGPPGFMMETTVKSGIDIGLVSGYVQFSGMVWYYRPPDPDTWGAWAEVKVHGSLLWGLVSATAGIEGALIGQGTSVLIYAVGSVSFEVCWIEVYSGSIWVTISSGGFDGGKGRNARYDGLIDEARNMADQMQAAKAELMNALAEAEMSLYQLDEVQRQAAGLALVERSGWVGRLLGLAFAAAEVESWPGGLPEELQGIRELLFGPEQQSLVQIRTELEQLRQSLNQEIAELQELQAQVLTRLDQYEQLVVEELPSIRDLSASGNPFQGKQQATVSVGDSTRRVQVGFQIDQAKAEQQKAELGSMREGFAVYQEAFIAQAGLLDARLQQLDEILFQSQSSFSHLMQRYHGIYANLVGYMERFIRFQQENVAQAHENLEAIRFTQVPEEVAGQFIAMTSAPTEQVVRELMSWTAANLSSAELENWTNLRISLINLLIQAQGGEGDYMSNAAVGGEAGLSPVRLFTETGIELWWNLPNRGWELSIELSEDRTAAAVASFQEDGGAFRESWGTATGLSDIVFDRKADLYALLYEIYDQLAVYGSGMMAVSGKGNAAGLPGLAGTGLSFRSAAAAQAISRRSVLPPAGTKAPRTATVGPLRPPQRDETGGRSAASAETWIPITRYFEGKRSEIAPYLELPAVTAMSGSLTSRDPDAAFFSGEFVGSHPVEVVEYAVRVRPGGSYPPWRSLGAEERFADAFFQGYAVERNYFFDLRVRGAGGLTIQRRGGFDLEFLDPEVHGEAFTSSVDSSDASPPTGPWVSLAETATANPQELYAQWHAADAESGIQRYEYAVGTHSAPEGGGADEAGQPEGDAGGAGFYLPGFGSALEAANQVVGMFDGQGSGAGAASGEASGEAVPTDILPWTDAGGRTEAIIKNLELQHGHRYVVSVRATNGVGQRSTGSSEPILVDLTPPEGTQITELIQETVDGYPNSVKFAFTFGEDPETEVAAHYVALGTSETTDDLFPWTEAVLDFGRIANLPVSAGSTVYLLVKVVNVLGLEAVVSAALTLTYVDGSPPPAPMVLTDPQQSAADGSQLSIGWNEVQDPESGIVSYAYGISSTLLADPAQQPELLSWVAVDRSEEPYYFGKRFAGGGSGLVLPGAGTEETGGAGTEETGGAGTEETGDTAGSAGFGYVQVGEPQLLAGLLGTAYEVHREDLNLSGRVYAAVKVTNGAGLSTVACSPPIIFDATPPESASVQAQPRQYDLELLECTLEAGDRESGIEAYRYKIDRVQEGLNLPWAVSGWIDAQAPPTGSISRRIRISEFPPPGLQYGNLYQVRLFVRNRSGLTRAAGPVTIEVMGGGPDKQGMPEARQDTLPPEGRGAP